MQTILMFLVASIAVGVRYAPRRTVPRGLLLGLSVLLAMSLYSLRITG